MPKFNGQCTNISPAGDSGCDNAILEVPLEVEAPDARSATCPKCGKPLKIAGMKPDIIQPPPVGRGDKRRKLLIGAGVAVAVLGAAALVAGGSGSQGSGVTTADSIAAEIARDSIARADSLRKLVAMNAANDSARGTLDSLAALTTPPDTTRGALPAATTPVTTPVVGPATTPTAASAPARVPPKPSDTTLKTSVATNPVPRPSLAPLPPRERRAVPAGSTVELQRLRDSLLRAQLVAAETKRIADSIEKAKRIIEPPTPPTPPASPARVLGQRTTLSVRPIQQYCTGDLAAGAVMRFRLTEPVTASDGSTIAANSEVIGRVAEREKSENGEPDRIALVLTSLAAPGGSAGLSSTQTMLEMKRVSTAGHVVKYAVIGTVLGAAGAAVLKKPIAMGAAIGAGVGSAAGGLTAQRGACIAADATVLQFVLQRDAPLP